MVGGRGNDMHRIDSGCSDTVIEAAGAGTDSVCLKATSNTPGANVENIFLDTNIISATTLTGNGLANQINGAFGADTMSGLDGNVRLQGADGNDFIFGSDGADKRHGMVGNDNICGDGAVDLRYGGTGADMFIFRNLGDAPAGARDRMMDFVAGAGKIDLSAIDTNSAMAGNQGFSFAGAKPFFGNAGDLYTTASLLGTVTTKARILVCDDEKPMRDLLHELLTDEAYAVTTARDGAALCRKSGPIW